MKWLLFFFQNEWVEYGVDTACFMMSNEKTKNPTKTTYMDSHKTVIVDLGFVCL